MAETEDREPTLEEALAEVVKLRKENQNCVSEIEGLETKLTEKTQKLTDTQNEMAAVKSTLGTAISHLESFVKRYGAGNFEVTEFIQNAKERL